MTVNEGEYFVRKRLGPHQWPWAVYKRWHGKDILICSFTGKDQARIWVAMQLIAATA